MDVQNCIEENKIIVIIRRLYGDTLMKVATSLNKGGIRLIEVTFDQSDPDCIKKTTQAIRQLSEAMDGEILIGAGTVLTVEQVDAAAEAGAKYIISPNINEAVVARTKELGLVSIPGAMTPTEVIKANECGADFVKIFPYIDLGQQYIKNIRGPISHVKLLATAGVTEENFSEVLACGFSGAGISGRLTDKSVVQSGNFDELTRRAQSFVKIAREA